MVTNIISKTWRKTITNPHFADNFSSVPLESCLNTCNPHKRKSPLFLVNTEPKRINYFRCEFVDENGEIYHGNTENDSRFQLYHAMRWRILHRASIVDTCRDISTSIFITLTLPQENEPITEWLRKFKQKLKRKGYIIYNYIWVLEFGENNTHPHYHIVITFENRKNWDISDFHADKSRWYGRCEAQICTKSAYRYLTKYLLKKNARCFSARNYGLSNNCSQLPKLKKDA